MKNTNVVTPDNGDSFYANGVKYTLQKLSIERYNNLQLFKKWLLVIKDSDSLLEFIKDIYNDIPLIMRDPTKGNSTIIKIYQVLEGMKEHQERGDIAFWICTLFFNREDEFSGEWSVELGQSKINDWKVENIDPAFFLAATYPLIETSIQSYENFFQNISQ